ncbi:heavy-metal-associated domain-containing protein [Faecalibaculum rodentium]|jgi:copper chaperone CopZ|uniref:heavy-metal-associated domain-containing protein n=2 Tax=Faecalibaculum rodentium TaxID=1702221 RepID=UPI0025AF5E00|nr:hypothetical protein [Faecalibaculum rodentium]
MRKITVKIEGMICPMCESHICDAIRKSFLVRKVTASRKAGEAVILADEPVSHEALKRPGVCQGNGRKRNRRSDPC